MNIEDMKAGPKFDALIAREVMGEVWDESRCRICGWPLKDKPENGCVAENCSLRPGPDRRADAPAPYSTDLTSAWLVVEKIHDLQPRFVLEAQPFVRPRVWWCSVYGHDRVEASTPSLAICRAALMACETVKART